MKFLAFLIFLLSCGFSLAQVTQEWVNRYDGPAGSFDIARKLLLNPDGSILVFGNSIGIGTSNDIVIIKYSPSGSEEWVTRYNSSNNKSDNVSSAVTDNNGNIYLTGFITDSSDLSQMAVVKIDSSGYFVWIKTLDTSTFTQSFGESISVSPDGNIYVTGTARNLSSNNDFVTMKFTPSGERKWLKVFNGTGNGDDNSVCLVTDSQNNAFITGSSIGVGATSDIVLLKYNNNGSLLFTKIFSGPLDYDDRPTSMTIDGLNNIIISGVTATVSGSFDYVTLKYTNSGNLAWAKTYNGPGNSIDYTYEVITDALNNVYVTGSSRNDSYLGSEDVLTIKYDSAGSVQWTNRFDGQAQGSDIGYCLDVDSNGNVYIGSAIDRGNVQLIMATIKLNSSGGFEWLQTYVFHSAPEDFPYSIAVDNLDNVYICGISFSGSSDYDIATIKYSQSIGISQIGNSLPEQYRLFQNYPNPFNPSTIIKFNLPQPEHTRLSVFNSLGKRIALLLNKNLDAGSYEFNYDASALPSGIYFYTLETVNFKNTRKMALIR